MRGWAAKALCAPLLFAGGAAYAGAGPLDAPLWRTAYEVRFHRKVRLGGDPGRPLPSLPHVEAILQPRPDAGKLPLEIRSAVFGP